MEVHAINFITNGIELFKIKIFEVKTSLGAPHTFYSQAVN
jgi:hypothetical protein